jgi:hypothetical protein
LRAAPYCGPNAVIRSATTCSSRELHSTIAWGNLWLARIGGQAMEVAMADNKRGVHFGGGFRYGPQSGMTFGPDGLTVLRYTNPAAARSMSGFSRLRKGACGFCERGASLFKSRSGAAPSLHSDYFLPLIRKCSCSPHVSAKTANHGGVATISAPAQQTQRGKKYHQIRGMAPAGEMS